MTTVLEAARQLRGVGLHLALSLLCALATHLPSAAQGQESATAEQSRARAAPPVIDVLPLVYQPAASNGFGFNGRGYRKEMLEHLRLRGFETVLERQGATLALRGTAAEILCLRQETAFNCRMAIEWQLLSMAQKRVVYQTTTTGAVYEVAPHPEIASQLIEEALTSLVGRATFSRLLVGITPDQVTTSAPADSVPPLDRRPDAARRKAERALRKKLQAETRFNERHALTPNYVHALLWGGCLFAVAGLVGAVITQERLDAVGQASPDLERLKVYHYGSWAALVLGSGSVITGISLRPSLPQAQGREVRPITAFAPPTLSIAWVH